MEDMQRFRIPYRHLSEVESPEKGATNLLDAAPWATPRMIAAIGMGESVLPPPATFDVGITIVAMMIHSALSVMFAFLFAFLARGCTVAVATMMGVVFGLVVYFVAFYGTTAVLPWFAMARGWTGIFAHVMYGAVLGLVYASIAQRVR